MIFISLLKNSMIDFCLHLNHAVKLISGMIFLSFFSECIRKYGSQIVMSFRPLPIAFSQVISVRGIYCALLLGSIGNQIQAQRDDLGSWNIVNVRLQVNERWSLFGEAQLRSLRFYDHFHYYEYKGGVHFKTNSHVGLSLGAGSYQTYREGGDFVTPKNNDEFRIWPQMLFYQSIGKLKVEQRYRAEMRFTGSGYRNRFRYRIGFSYPLGKDRNGFKPFQINGANEIFFTNKEPYFERNRVMFSINYKPSPSVTLQVGYLHQFDYRINDETGRDFLQIGYYLDLCSSKLIKRDDESLLKDN